MPSAMAASRREEQTFAPSRLLTRGRRKLDHGFSAGGYSRLVLHRSAERQYRYGMEPRFPRHWSAETAPVLGEAHTNTPSQSP